MHRITVTRDDDVRATLNSFCKRHGYKNRSEAIRDLVRHGGLQEPAKDGNSACFAALSYVYEHGTRDLAKRLTNEQHGHCDLLVATLHVHLNHHDCLEVAVLQGRTNDIRVFADTVTTQRGVRHGHLHVLPSQPRGPEARSCRAAAQRSRPNSSMMSISSQSGKGRLVGDEVVVVTLWPLGGPWHRSSIASARAQSQGEKSRTYRKFVGLTTLTLGSAGRRRTNAVRFVLSVPGIGHIVSNCRICAFVG